MQKVCMKSGVVVMMFSWKLSPPRLQKLQTSKILLGVCLGTSSNFSCHPDVRTRVEIRTKIRLNHSEKVYFCCNFCSWCMSGFLGEDQPPPTTKTVAKPGISNMITLNFVWIPS